MVNAAMCSWVSLITRAEFSVGTTHISAWSDHDGFEGQPIATNQNLRMSYSFSTSDIFQYPEIISVEQARSVGHTAFHDIKAKEIFHLKYSISIKYLRATAKHPGKYPQHWASGESARIHT